MSVILIGIPVIITWASEVGTSSLLIITVSPLSPLLELMRSCYLYSTKCCQILDECRHFLAIALLDSTDTYVFRRST